MKPAADKKSQLLAILNELAKQDENNCCLECGSASPRWASVSLGVFLCMVCAGLHRSLGVHLSRVKSLTLDSWTSEQVEFMKKHGNRIAKEYFEAGLPKFFVRPIDKNALMTFIRDKYEYRRYVRSDIPYDKWNPSEKSTETVNKPTVEVPKKETNNNDNLLKDIFSTPEPSKISTHNQNVDLFGNNKNVQEKNNDDLFGVFEGNNIKNNESHKATGVNINLFEQKPNCSNKNNIADKNEILNYPFLFNDQKLPQYQNESSQSFSQGLRVQQNTVVPQKNMMNQQNVMPQQNMMYQQNVMPQHNMMYQQNVMPQHNMVYQQNVMPQQNMIPQRNMMPPQNIMQPQNMMHYGSHPSDNYMPNRDINYFGGNSQIQMNQSSKIRPSGTVSNDISDLFNNAQNSDLFSTNMDKKNIEQPFSFISNLSEFTNK